MGVTSGYYEIDVNNRRLYSLIHYNVLLLSERPRMAHVVPKLFKAVIVFSDRATVYNDVISLTADQLKTQSGTVGGRKCGPQTFPQ